MVTRLVAWWHKYSVAPRPVRLMGMPIYRSVTGGFSDSTGPLASRVRVSGGARLVIVFHGNLSKRLHGLAALGYYSWPIVVDLERVELVRLRYDLKPASEIKFKLLGVDSPICFTILSDSKPVTITTNS
jgi:hypothetical protein